MKKFSLKKAKEGAAVQTKSGKDAKILLYDRDSARFPLVVIVQNKGVYCYTARGKFYFDKERKSDKDLAMKG
jgi:hypothetical protein